MTGKKSGKLDRVALPLNRFFSPKNGTSVDDNKIRVAARDGDIRVERSRLYVVATK